MLDRTLRLFHSMVAPLPHSDAFVHVLFSRVGQPNIYFLFHGTVEDAFEEMKDGYVEMIGWMEDD